MCLQADPLFLSRCPMCSHFDVSDASPSAKHEKGASIMAGSEVDSK